jgi:hypothetical protein
VFSIVSLDLTVLWANDKRHTSTGTKADTSRSNPLNLRTGVLEICVECCIRISIVWQRCVLASRRRELVTKSDTMKVIAHVVVRWLVRAAYLCLFASNAWRAVIQTYGRIPFDVFGSLSCRSGLSKNRESFLQKRIILLCIFFCSVCMRVWVYEWVL